MFSSSKISNKDPEVELSINTHPEEICFIFHFFISDSVKLKQLSDCLGDSEAMFGRL